MKVRPTTTCGPFCRRLKKIGPPFETSGGPVCGGMLCLALAIAGSGDIVSPSPPGSPKRVPVACTLLVNALVPLVRLRLVVPRFCVPDRQGGDPGLSELQEMLEGRWNPL